jgi:uncharacterized protein YjbI with pentapeptide repeats
LCGADLHGANLLGADLRGANLRGANLNYCKGVLSFTGEGHLLVYFKHDGTHYFKIGCMTETSDWWLANFETVGNDEDYSDSSINLYGEGIRLFSTYDLLPEESK